MSHLDPTTQARIDQEARALRAEFRDVDAETVNSYVNESMSEFADARIQVFVPILVRRFARDRLLERAGSHRAH